jgi:hypothetical protein
MTQILERLSCWNWLPYVVIGAWLSWEIYGRLP